MVTSRAIDTMKKTIRITAFVLLGLVVVLLGVQWWLGAKVRKELEKEVWTASHGAYQLEIGSSRVSLLSRTVVLKNITLRADTTVLNKKQGTVRDVNASIDKISATGVRFRFKDHPTHVLLRKFTIESPRIALTTATALKDTTGAAKPALQGLRQTLDRFEIGKFELNNGQVKLVQQQASDTTTYEWKDWLVALDDLRFGEQANHDGTPFHTTDIRMYIPRLRQTTAVKKTLLEVENIQYRGRDGILQTDSITLVPQGKRYQYAAQTPGHPDWTEIRSAGIRFAGFDPNRLVDMNLVTTDSVLVRPTRIESYKNRQLVATPRVKNLFYESVQRLPFGIDFRNVAIERVDVVYEELSPAGETPGRITFDNLQGNFDRLTNVTDSTHLFNKLVATGKLMNRGNMDVTFLFPVDSLQNHFEVQGTLGAIPLTAINPMITPLAHVDIQSGHISGMSFHIAGSGTESHVQMQLLYEKLEIMLLKHKKDQLKERPGLSKLVNNLILKDSNPKNGKTRNAEGKAKRDFQRSQFNYLWKSLAAGMKETVGIP